MKVTRTSGLPIEPEDIPKYQADLEAGLEAINQELGRFEKLNQTDQGTFIRRFQEMRTDIQKKYKMEDEWTMDVLSSKTAIKELVNRYGFVGFSRSTEGNRLQAFIIDKV